MATLPKGRSSLLPVDLTPRAANPVAKRAAQLLEELRSYEQGQGLLCPFAALKEPYEGTFSDLPQGQDQGRAKRLLAGLNLSRATLASRSGAVGGLVVVDGRLV
jgi:hypothetical protein